MNTARRRCDVSAILPRRRLQMSRHTCLLTETTLPCAVSDVLADVRHAADDTAVRFGGARHSEAHRAALLAVPLCLGLAHSCSYLLHGRHGAVQRRVRRQNGRRHRAADCRQRRRRRLLRRRPPQLSHLIRHHFR